MRITIQLDWVDEYRFNTRVAYYIVEGLNTYNQVYEWCNDMIMKYIDSDYCNMRINIRGVQFMDVDLLALRWAVEA